MSKISVDVSSARIPVLQVGYQGENEVTDVLFDISSWITEFGEGVAQLRVKRPGNSEEESYVLSLPITDGKAVWTVSETDTFNKGNGKVQLSYLVGNIVKKAVIYPYKVGKSIVGADNPVDPFDSWIERSKAWAIGKTLDGGDVPETDETYQNNAKYYAEQADILGSAQVVLATEQATLATEKATLATEKADAAAESETNAAASEAAVNGVSTQLTTRMSAIETEQAVQDARMDTFTSLPEGSTSGNAELADIRVGADGTTYDTAGNAVRGQISGLKSDLDDLEDDVYNKLLDKPQDIAPTILSGTPVVRDNSNTVVSVDGNTISATFNFDGDKWIAFPLPYDADEKDYDFYVTVDDASKINKIETAFYTTGSTSGISGKVFDVAGNNYSATEKLKTKDNPKFISIVLTRYAVSLVANVVIKEHKEVQVKDGLIPDFKQGKTSIYIGGQSGINSEESTTSDDGRYNTSFGMKSMIQNTTGNHNTSVGFQALEMNTTGNNNTALGEDALFENITGDNNTALGIRALQNNVSGSRNVSVGGSSMYNCTSGGMNVVIGTNAGGGITTESNNILIGHNEDVSAGVENSIGIGYWGTVEQSNTVQIGSSSQSLIICGKRITFNADGTVTWESV